MYHRIWVVPEGVGDLVEQRARRVEQLDQRLGVVAERIVVDDRGEPLQRAPCAQSVDATLDRGI